MITAVLAKVKKLALCSIVGKIQICIFLQNVIAIRLELRVVVQVAIIMVNVIALPDTQETSAILVRMLTMRLATLAIVSSKNTFLLFLYSNTFFIEVCNCNGFGVETANWGFTKANYTYDFECADNTGDCGPCFPGFTGLQCDTCADDYEFISDSSSSHTYGQFINCRKACPEGWKLLSKYYRNNYDYWNYEDDESQEFQDHYNNYPNYCYQTVSQPLSFDEAIANCTGMGATLLEPQWSGESYNAIFATNDQLENDADPGQEHWVGIKYDGGSEANS